MEDIGGWDICMDGERPSICTTQLLCQDQVLYDMMGRRGNA
jgi:hypothetical protein